MRNTELDHQMMARAIALAKKGRFTTSPNPNVGCVITKNGDIVGEGLHFKAGEPHAEVHALRAAGENAEGATAYVTLEPCSHYGRTPPCSEALIKAGVARVVCAMQDPNPVVAGRGVKMLRDAGVEVEVGVLESDARALNKGFLKRMETGKPFVQLKLAASLDGQTALSNGESKWITSPQARQDVQAYRAQSCAIVSTSKTVIDDNASLNVRWSELPESTQTMYPESELRQPARVILDRQQKLHQNLSLFQTSGKIEVVDPKSPYFQLNSSGQVDIPHVFDKLAEKLSIQHIWVEAGATLAASLIEQELVDELIVYLAPKLMGSDGRGLVHNLGLTSMQQAIDLEINDVRMVGPDIRITAKVIKNT
ncbi:bifunctional diaminohydroxyphosphoribosylaminopyrimidine deaminase/5-amino-6-(5-phosphoribosylamino)uracil reductase RibD [Vibrio nigripulchritudo]|uniref:bifunctional diaminohydroxyphosphoribosylaminopyrimidine deaminase/5-amino-6-(5-phosphoribosylamino)uracil reductase RibD n=1 Tax=Vibrio nigripulchritudo TaxID=28173 RepID=UPI0024932D12|nr:bifunctional diaminohydroxyphosphoribosylaminopyrimidine deaminase/5-amino-6-(5-phosphoribosylamino)uracil reductase RibD [Vibrio nigripulchritudo]BDU38154.1 riboflavin biosynthesis protein RibD [Vibrio nigripulchritudo]BDU43877.1 riboflavin biosynthesis protein RibD [Vibrio nigripulchritudo]